MAPMRLRRRMSCFTRTTVKFAASAFASGASLVCMLSAPTLKLPTLPVSRPPPTMGTVRPSCRPMRRLKNDEQVDAECSATRLSGWPFATVYPCQTSLRCK